jgi:hypothetical protein
VAAAIQWRHTAIIVMVLGGLAAGSSWTRSADHQTASGWIDRCGRTAVPLARGPAPAAAGCSDVRMRGCPLCGGAERGRLPLCKAADPARFVRLAGGLRPSRVTAPASPPETRGQAVAWEAAEGGPPPWPSAGESAGPPGGFNNSTVASEPSAVPFREAGAEPGNGDPSTLGAAVPVELEAGWLDAQVRAVSVSI